MTRAVRTIAMTVVLLAALLPQAAGAATMSVQVRQGEVRATRSFLGKIVATLSYGDRVETVEQGGGWVRVVVPGKKATGWIHGSALTAKRIVLRAGSRAEQAAASRGELALAGKGFNADIEAEFRKQNAKLDFAAIDRMQAVKVPQEKIEAFVRDGGLMPQEGGGR
ncbi:MAG TPA: SH3 domain-containing protein [Candidatus Deferrimicrobiaceae bacterium]